MGTLLSTYAKWLDGAHNAIEMRLLETALEPHLSPNLSPDRLRQKTRVGLALRGE